MSEAIPTGLHWVDAPCPRCGQIETVAIVLSSVLTSPENETPSLRVRAKGKAADHDCKQTRMSGVQQSGANA